MRNRPPRRVEIERVQTKLAAARLKPVKLRIASALLHHELGGDSRSSMRGHEYIQKLSAAAEILAAAIDLYRLDKGRMVLVAKHDLAGAQFLDGGNAMRTAAGMLHHPLAVRRAEALDAIEALVNETIET